MSASTFVSSRRDNISGGLLRRFLFYIAVSVVLSLLISVSLSDPAQAAVNNNPGDQYVFGADSLVSPDSYDQSALSINDNFVLWSEYDTSAGRHINYYKDLSKGQDEPKHALFDNDGAGGSPVYNQSAQRAIWVESFFNGVTPTTIYYKDVDLNNYGGCSGTLNACATALPATAGLYEAIDHLSLSPDGSKVAWRQGSGGSSQIYYYDFNTGQVQAMNNVSNHDQEQPSADNEWIVWSENWNNPGLGWNNSAIYAWRIGSSDPPVQIAANNGSNNTGVNNATISRNAAGEPIIVYSYWRNMDATDIRIYNLSSGTDQVLVSKGYIGSPDIDGDKVV